MVGRQRIAPPERGILRCQISTCLIETSQDLWPKLGHESVSRQDKLYERVSSDLKPRDLCRESPCTSERIFELELVDVLPAPL